MTDLTLFEPAATLPDVPKGGTIVRVTVPALPADDATVAGAARACWAEWRALESLGYDITCICSDRTRSGEWCQEPYDYIPMNCGVPMGWEYEDGPWHFPTLIRFDPGLDPRYEVAVVSVS